MEAMSDSLRMELKPWNIPVILVEPGRFHTTFQEKAYQDMVVDGCVLCDRSPFQFSNLVYSPPSWPTGSVNWMT